MRLIKTVVIVLGLAAFSYISAFSQEAGLGQASSEFQRIDTDRSGYITPAEMQAYHQKRFNELDKDKNGVIDAGELKEDKTMMFKNADKNNDGKITKTEGDAQFKEYLKGMDTNKDNKASEEEFKEYWPVITKF